MKKRIIILLIVLFIIPINVMAVSRVSCDYSVLSNLKKFAGNITYSYDYYIKENQAYFNITVSNITSEMYIVNKKDNKKYEYKQTNNGELVINDVTDTEKMTLEIYSNNSECPNEMLAAIYINLPVFNKFSVDPLCEENKEYKLCKRFLKTSVSYDIFVKQINKYIEDKNKPQEEEKEIKQTKEKADMFDLLIRFLPLIIIVMVIAAIYIINQRKKNSFDFKL